MILFAVFAVLGLILLCLGLIGERLTRDGPGTRAATPRERRLLRRRMTPEAVQPMLPPPAGIGQRVTGATVNARRRMLSPGLPGLRRLRVRSRLRRRSLTPWHPQGRRGQPRKNGGDGTGLVGSPRGLVAAVAALHLTAEDARTVTWLEGLHRRPEPRGSVRPAVTWRRAALAAAIAALGVITAGGDDARWPHLRRAWKDDTGSFPAYIDEGA